MDIKYNFGVPAPIIWGSHILIGATLVYLGYLLFEGEKVNKYWAVVLMLLGTVAALYHIHIASYKISGGA
jgi:hypothetical protein